MERAVDRGIERLAGGFRADSLGVRRTRRATTQYTAPGLGEPGLRRRTSAVDSEQPYRGARRA